MKKQLLKNLRLRAVMLVALLCAGISGAWGETVTYTFTSAKWAAKIGSTDANWTSGKDGGGFSNNGIQVTTNSTGANGTSPIEYKNISEIVVTYNTNKSAGEGSIVVKIGDNDIVTNNVAYSGSGDGRSAKYTTKYTFSQPQSGNLKLTVNTTTNSIYLVSVAITYNPNSCATPIISGEETFEESTEVSISCTTEGATIQYSKDGTTWTNYSAPLELTETTTIQAKATKSGMTDSDIASKTFTKIETLANIDALTAKTEAGTYNVTFSDAVVTYVNGNYAYIEDTSGAVVLYKSNHGMVAGNILNGTPSVAFEIRNGNPQITNLDGCSSNVGTAPEPTEVAASAWNKTFNNELSKYYKVTGATITKTDGKFYVQLGNDNVQLFGRGDASTISVSDLNATYTIVGFPTMYNTTKELQIFEQPTAETSTREELTMEFIGGTLEFSDPDNFVAPTLSIKNSANESVTGLTITYESNNTEVATVEASTGNVTIGGYGEAVITASFSGNDDYIPATASYSIKYQNTNVGVYTWDLSKASYDGTPTADLISWSCNYATMTNAKGTSGTGVNNYIPKTYSSTRMYKGNVLTITPASGYRITSVVFTATTNGYATALGGSTWTNANKPEYDKENVTITPTDGTREIKATIGGTCGLTGVTVSYERNTTPTITMPSSLEITSAGSTGTLQVSYQNIADNSVAELFFCDADGESATYDWIAATFDNNKNIGYEIAANTATSARTAYLQVNVGSYSSNRIIITQAAFVRDYVILPYEYNSTGAMVADETGLTGNGLGSYTSDGPGIRFDGADDYLLMKMNEAPKALYFDIKGNGNGQDPWAGTFTVQTSADGETFEDLESYTELSSTTETKVFTDFSDDVRYIKWTYTIKTVGNVALGNILVDKHKFEINQACYDNDTKMYYGTYSNPSAFVVPEGVKAHTVSVAGGTLSVVDYPASTIVPANTGVMVSSATYGVKTVNLTTETGTALANNMLKPTGAGITAEAMTAANSGCKFYYLTMNGDQIGFWWRDADGAAFDMNVANKAYLAVPADQAGNIKGFSFNDVVDGIKAVETTETESNAIYNLAGQRISKMQKGIYIVNGKKFIRR